MFETIVVRRQSFVGPQVMDLGFIAETLFFYGRVRLVIDHGMLIQLARQCGPDLLLEAVTSCRLEMSYLPNGLGVRTDNSGTPSELHQPTTYKIVGYSTCRTHYPKSSGK